MNVSNMSAYGAQIDLKLLNDIIIFVLDTAKADRAQKKELRVQCIFPLSRQSDAAETMQQDYGFLYLGELLERYEERFGMTLPSRRAIALALGYTRDIATPGMFVGNQRSNFIQEVRRYAKNDIYLTGALYLLHMKAGDATDVEQRLKEWAYTKTEELIFAMSLFLDKEQAFAQFGSRLVDLLGKGCTLPVFGNTDILNSTFAMLFPLKKRMKARSMDLLRALLSLPVSYVKEGGRHHGWLLEHGYTPLEIAYANTAALCGQCVPGGPGRNSLTVEKLIVALFRTVLASDQPLPAGVYQQLTEIYQAYSRFSVKCHGKYRLSDTLQGGLRIQTPETMAWFITCTGEPLHPATLSFDVMESKWDTLAASLDTVPYRKLFASCLGEDMDAAQIQKRLDRYQALTKGNYTDCYSAGYSDNKFSLLVKAGVIDLWTAFQSCLSEGGSVSDTILLCHIKDYCYGIKTIHAFEFLKQFLHQYGYQGKKLYLDQCYHGFESELWKQESYGSGEVTLKLQRDFLTDDPAGQRLLLHWLDEYFFLQKPNRYLNFAIAVLKDKDVSALLSPEDQRGMFDAVISQSKLASSDASQLKQRYLTPEEQQTDREAKEAAKAEAERQNRLNMIRDVESCYADSNDGTFGFVMNYLDKYRHYSGQKPFAHCTVRDGLEQLLHDNGFALSPDEANRFLSVCRELFHSGTLSWAELQSYILKVKEVKCDDPDGDPNE